jgi:hypothetical protein
MSYAMPRVPLTPSTEVRGTPNAVRYVQPATARAAANEPARSPAEAARPIEPMLLVYQERAETVRLIVAAVARGYRALAQFVRA